MIEFDFGFDPQAAQMRPQLAVAFALGDADRLEHLDIAPRCRQRDDAGLIDRRDERRGAAVHDRNFGAVDFDDGIVDAEAMQGREHVFGGRYRRAAVVAEHGGEFGRGHRTEIGASIRGPVGRRLPQRKKTMPVSASAGCNVRVAGEPEWTPMPATVT